MTVKHNLKECHFIDQIYTAKDGIELLDKLRSGSIPSPYIVLMDIKMPRMNGLECMKEIRADKDLKQIVIFVLTTPGGSDKDKNEAYKYNPVGYIIKSKTADEFTVVMKMLNNYCSTNEPPIF